MPIFTSKKLTDFLGEEYLLVRSEADIPQRLTYTPLNFSDPYYTVGFLRKLHTPREFWRDIAQNFDGNAHLHWMDDSTILQRVADLIIRKNLNLYRLQDTNRWNISSKPFKAKDGHFYQLAPKKSPIFQDAEPKLEFSTTDQAKKFIQDNQKALNLSALGKQLGLSSAKTKAENSPALLDAISLALVTGDAVVMRQKTYSHTKPAELVSTAAANNKSVPLSSPSDLLDTWISVKLTDEVGEAVKGVELNLAVDGKHQKFTTDGGGKIKAQNVKSRFAIASLVDAEQLYDQLEERWEKLREGDKPAQNILEEIPLPGAVNPISLKNEVEHQVIFTPPKGKLHAVLKDKTGRKLHKNCAYTIEGPVNFSGETDDQGALIHPEVLPGDYLLKLTLSYYKGTEYEVSNTYSTPLIVLDTGSGKPQERLIGAAPRVTRASIGGMLFDTNKSFLLPTAIKDLKKVRQLYGANNPSKLLLVGHTDTTAQADINDPLALERAEKTQAYLEDKVDEWLSMYESSIPQSRRWGNREDRLMIRALPDFADRFASEDIITWFQRTRSLKVDGIAGPQTRTQLITEYMALDGVKLEDTPELQIEISTTAYGEKFPVNGSGENLEESAEDDKNDQLDRRVEWFFFDNEFGILPAPDSLGGDEYLAWREIAEENHDYLVERIFRKSTILEIHDTLFRSNSCVVLPEGETPDSDKEHGSISSVGLFATALRYNEENPGKSLFIAGHTDSTATVEFNQTLSEERAKCALSVLEGDRDAFINLVNKRHKVSDYKQIFSWCCKAFEDLSFNCDPGAIDDNEYSGIESVKQFQKDYNTNKSAMGYDSHADLSVDGDIGPLTWGAIFDVYEYALRQELGADIPELAELRNKVDWVDDDRKALGFSEHHPIDKVGLDNTRSQANRRVEFLFFEAGDEPDLILAESDPDLSDIYLTEEYKHASIEPMLSALPWKAEWLSADSSANMETPKTMQVTAPGLPSGQPCSLELFAEANGEEAFLLKAFVVSSADNQVSKDNSLWYDPSKSQVKQDHLEVLPAFKFYFTLSAGGRTVTSPKILYADKLELRFVHSGTEIPPEDRQVLVATPWGRIEKELTEEGKFILENIPPGGARVVSFSERLVTEA